MAVFFIVLPHQEVLKDGSLLVGSGNHEVLRIALPDVDSLQPHKGSFLFFDSRVKPSCAHGLLKAVCSGVTPHSALRTT